MNFVFAQAPGFTSNWGHTLVLVPVAAPQAREASLLDVHQVAADLGWTEDQVRWRWRKGTLPSKRVGGRLYCTREMLTAWKMAGGDPRREEAGED